MALKLSTTAAVLFLTGSAAFSQVPTCDRAWLNGFVDQYLAALVAKNAKQLPLAPNARYTENGVELALDDGIWGIENKLLGHKLYFADPQRGQVGFFGTITWNDGTVHPVNTPFDEPFSFTIAELFKILGGKMRQIEALVLNVPYGMPTGWK